jgi:hypothetical protein
MSASDDLKTSPRRCRRLLTAQNPLRPDIRARRGELSITPTSSFPCRSSHVLGAPSRLSSVSSPAPSSLKSKVGRTLVLSIAHAG